MVIRLGKGNVEQLLLSSFILASEPLGLCELLVICEAPPSSPCLPTIFKEGEVRRKEMESMLSRMDLPQGSALKVEVTRHPRRNFAMVDADVNSYQEAEILTDALQEGLRGLKLPDGNRVRVTGLPALFHDLNIEAVSALKKAEIIGIPICFIFPSLACSS